MSSSVRFPAELMPPTTDGYGDSFEESRQKFSPEIGQSRRRLRTRRVPRRFNVQWTFSQDEYQVFDKWWQNSIAGGSIPFDIQILDDVVGLTWYTVYWIGEYQANIVDGMNWSVSGVLQAKEPTFGATRPSGTDELRGLSDIGILSSSGYLLIGKVLRGLANIEVTPSARFLLPALYGSSTVGMFQLPSGKLAPFPVRGSASVGVESATGLLEIGVVSYFPELSRQWQGLSLFSKTGSQTDLRDPSDASISAVKRDWMEI